MLNRRTFLKTATAAGVAGASIPQIADASLFGRKSAEYFGVHPFIESHPEAVFIMRTNVNTKTDAKAKKAVGESFSRSVFVPMNKPGIPVSHKIAIKPNLTGHSAVTERFSLEDTMGIATDPDYVEGFIEGMKDLGPKGKQFYLREVNGTRIFEPRGYYKVAKRTGADLRDLRGRVSTIDEKKIAQWSNAPVLDDDLLQWRDCPDGKIHRKIPYLWPVNAPDAFNLNIAKFKAHFMGLTLASKNFQGSVANGYQHFCTKFQGIGNLPDEHKNPDAVTFIEESLRRHKADGVPRWDKPEMDSKDPAYIRPEGYTVTCQEVWSHRALDNLSASNVGLHIVEGIYGRDGDGFLLGPNPLGNEDNYKGAAWDYMTNIIIFGKDPVRVDLVGKWLGGHEPGNFGFFHIAMERGKLNVMNPMNVPVYLWEEGRTEMKPLDSFERTPLKTCYLQRNYNGMNEPVYHLVNEHFDYTKIDETAAPKPSRPFLSLMNDGLASLNGIIAFEYGMPRESEVLIELYDESDKLITVLKRSIAHEGYHMASWNTEGYKSGKYSCRFRCDGIDESVSLDLKV